MTQTIPFCFTSKKAKELYNGKPPQYETPHASGFDLRAVSFETKYQSFGAIHNVEKDCPNDKIPDITGYTVFSQKRIFIKTGIRFAIPIMESQNKHIQICSRSGLALKDGVIVLNAPGILDNDYRGEVGVNLYNAGDEKFEIKFGDRIAQGIFYPSEQVKFEEVSLEDFEEFHCDTQRGVGGFGSTGKQ